MIVFIYIIFIFLFAKVIQIYSKPIYIKPIYSMNPPKLRGRSPKPRSAYDHPSYRQLERVSLYN